jgi:hypothetical protein
MKQGLVQLHLVVLELDIIFLLDLPFKKKDLVGVLDLGVEKHHLQ